MSDPALRYIAAIKKRVETLAFDLRSHEGDFDKLDGRLIDGCWAMRGSFPDVDLASAEKTLRELADSIAARRERLMSNFKQAAE